MMTDRWFISEIDHRISTALIFFLLLLLIGNKKRRSMFPLRATLSLVGMCLVSWGLRYVTDVLLTGPVWQGMGYSVHLLVMSLLCIFVPSMISQTSILLIPSGALALGIGFILFKKNLL